MIGKLLGHTQMQTTARYAHLACDSVKASGFRVGDSIGMQIAPPTAKADTTTDRLGPPAREGLAGERNRSLETLVALLILGSLAHPRSLLRVVDLRNELRCGSADILSFVVEQQFEGAPPT